MCVSIRSAIAKVVPVKVSPMPAHTASPAAYASGFGPAAPTQVLSAKVVPVCTATSPALSASPGADAPAALPLGPLASPSASGLGVPSAVPSSPGSSAGEKRTFGVPWTHPHTVHLLVLMHQQPCLWVF